MECKQKQQKVIISTIILILLCEAAAIGLYLANKQTINAYQIIKKSHHTLYTRGRKAYIEQLRGVRGFEFIVSKEGLFDLKTLKELHEGLLARARRDIIPIRKRILAAQLGAFLSLFLGTLGYIIISYRPKRVPGS